MFSNRIRWGAAANRLMRALEAKKAAGAALLDLTESNPTRAGFRYEEGPILEALARPAALRYEPDPRGLPAARRAVAEYYRERGRPVEEGSLVLASGTSEAYAWLFKLLADPGGEVLVPKPGYPLLEVLTALESVRLAHYPLRYGEPRGWSVDLERLRDSISTRTKAVVAVSPNNPTGNFLKEDELAAIGGLCRQFGLALIVDEVFCDYGGGPAGGRGEVPAEGGGDIPAERRVESAVNQRETLTFVLNGFSKVLGLPQVKLAWVQVSGPEGPAREAGERLEFIADAYLSVSTPVQQAAPALLRGRGAIQAQIRRRLAENDGFLRQRSAGVPLCRVLKREGGWYAVLALAERAPDEDLALRLLERDGVLVHPGYFYDFPSEGFLVVSLLTPVEVFREGVERVLARLQAGR
jgi:hypothetical protein